MKTMRTTRSERRLVCLASFAAVLLAGLPGSGRSTLHLRLLLPRQSIRSRRRRRYANAPEGTWQPAQPQDAMLKGKWWEVFNEPELNGLEEQLDINNQNIKQYFEKLYGSAGAGAGSARELLSDADDRPVLHAHQVSEHSTERRDHQHRDRHGNRHGRRHWNRWDDHNRVSLHRVERPLR